MSFSVPLVSLIRDRGAAEKKITNRSRISGGGNMPGRRGAVAVLVLALICVAAPRATWAQNSSKDVIRIVIPFAPAGSADVLARLLQPSLQAELKQTVIVENRAGAGSNIGTSEVARARPDGLTLLITTSAFVVNPGLYKNVPYDFAKDFAPIGLLPVAPNVFAVTPKQGGIGSVPDLIARAKADPQKFNYSSPGNGTAPQLTMELFKLETATDITNIPYNGGGPATAALMGGTVDVLSTALPGAQGRAVDGFTGRSRADSRGLHERHRPYHGGAMADASRRPDIQGTRLFRHRSEHRAFLPRTGRDTTGGNRTAQQCGACDIGARRCQEAACRTWSASHRRRARSCESTNCPRRCLL